MVSAGSTLGSAMPSIPQRPPKRASSHGVPTATSARLTAMSSATVMISFHM